MTEAEIGHLAEQLAEVIKKIGSIPDTMSAGKARALRIKLEQAAAELASRLEHLDPVKKPSSFFDPSHPGLFGTFAAVALIGQERAPLDDIGTKLQFYGAGIYAIYYNGDFELYRPISGKETPIYVGKADPKSAAAKTPKQQGEQLCGRLGEHRKNIVRASASLKIQDFECRHLVVASGWEAAAEKALIHLFQPIWNKEVKLIQGFGKHGDSPEMRQHKRSPWDVLHEGRSWSKGQPGDKKTPDQIKTELEAHFKKNPPIPDLEHVLKEMLNQVRVPA